MKPKDSKAWSLVFSFQEGLSQDDSFDSPEPNFGLWIEKALSVDLATMSDNYRYDKLPEEERDASLLFHTALEATGRLLDLFQEKPNLFRKVASELSFLPSFLSWHPDADRFNRTLYKASHLGRNSMYCELKNHPKHLAHQSWPVRYAYGIIATIDLTLDTYSQDLPIWAEVYGYGTRHPVGSHEIEAALAKMNCNPEKAERLRRENMGAYRVLPKWTKGLQEIRQPITRKNVLDYWRVGKAMILEEMPDFHLEPEWESYHRRRYKGGAKDGTVQHAIFKDILSALRTISPAGVSKATLPHDLPTS
jgi:hypothetical protein